MNIKVFDNPSEYKVSTIPFLVYLVKTTSVKEVECPKISPNIHVITEFVDNVASRDTLVDVVGVVTEVIERKIVNPTYRVTVKLRDNSDAEIIMTVWEEYALQLDDSIEKNHFVRKPLVVMLTLAKIKDPKACRSCQNQVTHTLPRYKLVLKMEQNREKANFHFLDATCIKIFGKMADECHQELIEDEPSIGKLPNVGAETLSQDYHPTPADYDPGKTAFVTPAKRMSDQQGSSEFEYDEYTPYQLSRNKHIKVE
ncbi:hypothetical protein glysoja_032565 [Glycine soja]|uniref:Replication factor A C-terminal domain-containing protein n=1 Tax=Glycine soja TaxID=3848 RepID=A0A0B2SAQ8_GLYSO|nr:hypothetical protein glysoja_032565 [Glycine soja]